MKITLLYIAGLILLSISDSFATEYPFNYHRHLYGAEQGYAKSQYQTALLYMEGEYIAFDYDKGLYWLNKAVEQNYPPALCTLAAITAEGKEGIVEKDKPKARKLVDKGIELSEKNQRQRFMSFCRTIKKDYQLSESEVDKK